MLLFKTNDIKKELDNSSFIKSIKDKLIYINTLKENKFNIKYFKTPSNNRVIKKGVSFYLTSYIIIINISRRNSSIVITDRTGKIKSYCTSNTLGFSRTQKYTIIAMLKKVIYNYNFLNDKTSIIVFKGLRRYHKLIISRLKKKLHIKAIIYNNSLPHNGCRPKKIRRL